MRKLKLIDWGLSEVYFPDILTSSKVNYWPKKSLKLSMYLGWDNSLQGTRIIVVRKFLNSL